MNIKKNIIKIALRGLNIIKGLPLKLIKKVLPLLLFMGCLEYTEQKPIEQDSIWVLVENGDYWVGKWEGKIFLLQFKNDTIYYKEKK